MPTPDGADLAASSHRGPDLRAVAISRRAACRHHRYIPPHGATCVAIGTVLSLARRHPVRQVGRVLVHPPRRRQQDVTDVHRRTSAPLL